MQTYDGEGGIVRGPSASRIQKKRPSTARGLLDVNSNVESTRLESALGVIGILDRRRIAC